MLLAIDMKADNSQFGNPSMVSFEAFQTASLLGWINDSLGHGEYVRTGAANGSLGQMTAHLSGVRVLPSEAVFSSWTPPSQYDKIVWFGKLDSSIL